MVKLKINIDELNRNTDALKRAFFKEAMLNNWTCEEQAEIYSRIEGLVTDFDELVDILLPSIDSTDVPEHYQEPPPIPIKYVFEGDCLEHNPSLYVFQYSLSDQYTGEYRLMTDD